MIVMVQIIDRIIVLTVLTCRDDTVGCRAYYLSWVILFYSNVLSIRLTSRPQVLHV